MPVCHAGGYGCQRLPHHMLYMQPPAQPACHSSACELMLVPGLHNHRIVTGFACTLTL